MQKIYYVLVIFFLTTSLYSAEKFDCRVFYGKAKESVREFVQNVRDALEPQEPAFAGADGYAILPEKASFRVDQNTYMKASGKGENASITYTDILLKINEKEVASYQWLPLPVIKDKISKNPEKFTPWFKEALEIAVLSRI